MASASLPVEPNEKECSICHEEFTEPKLLSCGHLLCRHCLMSWLTSQKDAKCPLCRCAIVDPEDKGSPSRSWEDVAESFPTDLAMKAVVESQQLLSKDHACQACITQAASSLCLNCGDLFCPSCVTIHGRMSATRHHTVESLSSLTAEKLAASRRSSCAVHADETCKLFCHTHGVSICVLCATSMHRSCPEVKGLGERAEEARAVLAELAAWLDAGEAALEAAVRQLDRHLEDAETRAAADIAEMEATCDRLESAVKACKRRLKELTLSAIADLREAVHAGKACLLQRRGKLTSHSRAVQRADGVIHRDDVSDMTTVLKKCVHDLDCSVTLPREDKVVSTVKLVIDPEAMKLVERGLSELGQIKVKVHPAFSADQSAVLRFHDNHTRSVVLSNNQQTAEKTGAFMDGGIVVSCDPMIPHRLYEVRVDKSEAGSGCYMPVGATTAAPDTLTLPGGAAGWSSAVVIYSNNVGVNSKFTGTSIGKKLVNLPEGDRVGVMMDDTRSLHLFVNGKDQGVAAPHLPDPCFAFFQLNNIYRQITALPVQLME